MKYVLVIGDGMSDRPVEALGGKTPLMTAVKPNMDRLAREGTLGTVNTCPKGFNPGTEVAVTVLMGYDPKTYFTGRGPLEALGRGVELKKSEIAWRCNLVTVSPADLMLDYSAGHITDSEAKELMLMLDKRLGGEEINFMPGVSYRHLMIWRGGSDEVKTFAPHDITGKPFRPHMPAGRGEKKLAQLIDDSRTLLEGHEINRARRSKGLHTANMIWPWSPGRFPKMPTIQKKYGVVGGVISAVDIVKGIGVAAGLEVIRVPGATGYFDTNYTAKGEAAVKALKKADFVVVHVEAPDEAGHEGLEGEKVKAIEQIDEKVLGAILKAQPKLGDLSIMVMPDHATPISVKGHVDDLVPFIIWRSNALVASGVSGYDEESAKAAPLKVDEGWKLMDSFFLPAGAAPVPAPVADAPGGPVTPSTPPA